MDRGDTWMLGLMVFGPAVIGLAALVGAMVLFASAAKPRDASRVVRLVGGGMLLTVALGIGACYGVVLGHL